MPDDITTKANRIGQQAASNLSGPAIERVEQNLVSGMASSAFSSGLELFGLDPLPSAESFRAEHPTAAGVAGFTGTLGTFAVPLGAKAKIKSFDKAVEGFAEKGSNAFTQGARRGVATFAPLEAARVGSTAVVAPEDLKETVFEGGVNLALEAVGGGAISAFRSAGKVNTTPPVPVGTVLNDAKQLRLRDALKEFGTEGLAEGKKLELQREVSELEAAIRLEEVGNKGVAFELADPEADGRDIARLFKDTSSNKGNVKRARLAQAGNGFSSKKEADNALAAAGLTGNLDAVSLPRHISFGRKSDAAKVQGDFLKRGRMQTLDDNTLMAKTSDGTFVMAKKIAGKIGTADEADEYVVFRTAQPGRFVNDVKEFADSVNERMLFLRTEDRITPTGSSILDQANQVVSSSPLKEFQDAHAKLGLGGKSAEALARNLGFAPGEVGSSFAVQRGKAFAQHYLTPALASFKKGPGASHASFIWAHSRMIRDNARLLSQRLINGEAVTQSTKGFAKVFGDPTTTGNIVIDGEKVRSVDKIIESMSKEDINKFSEVAEIVAGGEDAVKAIDDLYGAGEISKELQQGLKDINKLDKFLTDEVRATQKATGNIELNPLEGHLMLSRVWQGDFRAPIYNRNGELVYMASGDTPKAADDHARAVIEESGSSSLKFEPAERFDAKADIDIASRLNTSSDEYALLAKANTKLFSDPQTFKERKGIKGFKKDFTKKELKDRITSHINERTEYMSGVTMQTALDTELATLRDIDPKTFSTLNKRLEQLNEVPGPLSAGVNKATDTLLKPVLGRNSATKISAGINEFFFATQLGMGNLAFPVLNAMTFAQTVFPEVSYVINAADNRVMRDYYEVAIAGGSDLKPRGGIHHLSTPKLMAQSVKKMMTVKDDAVLSGNLDRAVNEGVVDPKMLEEFIGKGSITEVGLNDVLSGEESIFNFMRSLSGWLPSKSERFARGHSFTVGHLLGGDILGLQDEALYQFSKKFTERTMYNYGTADRATIMTGPVGRTFGLFKNWQTHYLFSMMQYAGEGAKFGNWAPLMWQMGGTAAVGGVSATPLFGVANAFSEMTTDKSAMENLYEAFGGTEPDGTLGTASDAVFLGLPAFLGVSLSGNASAPGSDPARDAAQLASFPQLRRMQQLGKTMGEAFDQWGATGNHPIDSEAVRDGLTAALAPKVWSRSAQITNEDALKSLTTGKVVLNDLSLAEKMMWQAGFTPRRVGVTYEAADELWKDQNKKREAITAFGKGWMEAQAEQDWDTLNNIQEKAMILGLDISSIVRSADTQRDRRDTEQIERQFSPEARLKLQQLGLPGF